MRERIKMKISVIIPVYNSSKYLESCIESIRNQTYANIEVLLVDDGSSDGSERICDEYAKLDERIKCIHQKNAGTSAARNTGIKHATGDYIMFMDNDDYWKETTGIETIVNQLNESNADALFFSIMHYWEDKDEFTYPKKCSRDAIVGKNPEDALKQFIQNGLLYVTVWSKVVKRSIILENNILFPVGKRNEDSEWTANMMLHVNSYDWYELPFYVYRKGHISAQTSKPNTYKMVLDLKEIILKYYELINANGRNEDFKRVYKSYLAYLYSVWMAEAEMIKEVEIKKDILEMKQISDLLDYDIDPSVKLVKMVYKFLGYNVTAKLLKCYMKRLYNIKE